MVASTADIILLSSCSFVGNVGAALTGFGQAIIYLFVYQIVELAGYEGDFKFAVMIQSLSLFAMQPFLLHSAGIRKNAHRRVLWLFVPITLISTPLGQLTSDKVPVKTIKAVAGALVTFVACRELWLKRNWFLGMCTRKNDKKKKETDEEGGDVQDGGTKVETVGKDEIQLETNNNGHDTSIEGAKEEDEFVENSIKSDENPTNSTVDPESLENNTATLSENNNYDPTSTISSSTNAPAQSTSESQNKNNKTSKSTSTPPHEEEEKKADDDEKLTIGCNKATSYTLLAGGSSGFLGGMVAIRGPPLIFYFLHPPHPITFTKASQRATGVVIMFCNVTVRMIYYLVDTFTFTNSDDSSKLKFEAEDWRLYLSVVVCAIAGGMLGNLLFGYLKDSKDTIRGILAVFLMVCGASLLISAFA